MIRRHRRIAACLLGFAVGASALPLWLSLTVAGLIGMILW